MKKRGRPMGSKDSKKRKTKFTVPLLEDAVCDSVTPELLTSFSPKTAPSSTVPVTSSTPKTQQTAKSASATSASSTSNTADIHDSDEQPLSNNAFEEDFVPADAENSVDGLDTDGWSSDAIKDLCLLHIPRLNEYNGGDIAVKRNYWKEMQQKLNQKGYSGEAFDSSTKISKKWRYIFCQYNKVKDNNGRTGRGKMKYKHYAVMHEIFIDNDAGNLLTDPNFLESGETLPINQNRRNRGGRSEKTHQEIMRDMQAEYNRESLRLQEEALKLEREKLDLLRQILNKN